MARTWKAAAIALGREHGENAAGWWEQENGGGRDTRSAADLREWALETLRRLDDGDPETLEAMPAPDLSGQWADAPTPRTIAEECGADFDSEAWQNAETDLCDAYDEAFRRAADRAVYRHLRQLAKAPGRDEQRAARRFGS